MGTERDKSSDVGKLNLGHHSPAYLALSGGGGDGAFGAGLLAGWSETGTPPTLSIVPGGPARAP